MRSLRDMGIIERTNYTYHLTKDMDRVAIPSTIQDVIMARVDSLPDAAEGGASGWISHREGIQLRVDQGGYGIARTRIALPSLCFSRTRSFSTNEGSSLNQPTFSDMHSHVRWSTTRYWPNEGNCFTRRSAQPLRNSTGTISVIIMEPLVEHFLASESHEKAAQYAKLASKKAEKSASLNDAILYAEKGIACLERLPVNDEIQKKIIDGRTVLAFYLMQMGDWKKAKEAVDPVMKSGTADGYYRRLSQMYTVTGAYEYWVEEDFPRAIEHLTRALELGEQMGDMVSVLVANWWLGFALAFDCQFQEAFIRIDTSLKINMAVSNLWGASTMTSLQGWFQFWHGQVELSYRTSNEALKLAEQSGDIYSSTWAHTCRGLSCYGRGAFEEAIENLTNAVDIGERISLLSVVSLAHFFLAETYLEIGENEVAESHCRKSVELLDSAGFLPSWSNLNKMALEKARALSGEKLFDLKPLHLYVRDNRVKLYEGWSRRYLAEILLIIDDQHIAEAQHWIEEAIEADKRNQTMFYLGRDHAVYAELFKRKGDREKAKEQLGRAIDIYKECGADGWVTRAEEELAKLS